MYWKNYWKLISSNFNKSVIKGPGAEPKLRVDGTLAVFRNYSFTDGGIFVSYHQEMGNLLDIINTVKVINDFFFLNWKMVRGREGGGLTRW